MDALVSEIQNRIITCARPVPGNPLDWSVNFDTYCRLFPDLEYVRKLRPQQDSGFWAYTYSGYYYFLYQLVKEFNLGAVLELGTAEGVSAVFMAAAGDRVRVVTVNITPSPVAQAVFSNTDRIKFIVNDSLKSYDTVREVFPEVDLLFIDSLHESDHLVKEFELYKNLVKVGGFIVFDDIDRMPEGWNKLRWSEMNYEFERLSYKLHWTGFGIAKRIK